MTKTLLSFLFVAGIATIAIAGETPKSEHKVNTTDSKIEWTARKVTGKHIGTVAIKEGKVEIKDGMLTKASITIDMTTIIVEELSSQGKAKLEGHLKSADFFEVEKYPTATLVATKIISLDEGDYTITANLTIKGITQPITFNAMVIPDGKKYRAKANLVVDRTKYDVRYGSSKFFDDLGDSTIYDDFDLAISLIIE